MLRNSLRLGGLLTMILVAQFAQAEPLAPRGEGWDLGFNANYQLSKNLSFEGGTGLDVEDAFGFGLTYGYRFSSRLELQFAVDWLTFDYVARIQSSITPGLFADVNGDMHSLTPRLTGIFNFFDRPLTPYVSAGVGWSFIDTGLADAPTELGCWWDPWFGQICAPYADTKRVDYFRYQIGAGVRWDFHPSYTMRLGYEKQWMDADHSSGQIDFDQFRLAFELRY